MKKIVEINIEKNSFAIIGWLIFFLVISLIGLNVDSSILSISSVFILGFICLVVFTSSYMYRNLNEQAQDYLISLGTSREELWDMLQEVNRHKALLTLAFSLFPLIISMKSELYLYISHIIFFYPSFLLFVNRIFLNEDNNKYDVILVIHIIMTAIIANMKSWIVCLIYGIVVIFILYKTLNSMKKIYINK